MPRSLVFSDFHEPALIAGDYRLEVDQQARGTDATGAAFHEEVGGVDLCFSVQALRFRLDPRSVDAVFPPPHARGGFAGVLPHVLLHHDTLPWERAACADAPEPRPPWLALLVFTAEEWAGVRVVGGPDQDGLSVDELIASASDPSLTFDAGAREDQQHPDDRVQAIDVPPELAAALCPLSTELGLLCHTRTAKEGGQEDSRALVVAPRALHGGEAGVDYTACLVSVEDRFPASAFPARSEAVDAGTAAAPAGLPLAAPAGKPVRFVLLHRWSFHCAPELPAIHSVLGAVLGVGGFSEVSGVDTGNTTAVATLRREVPEGLDPAAARRLEQGFVPVPHRLRDGSRSAAWYRGPLVPLGLDSTGPTAPPTVRSADALLGFDDELGMFDLSYAAAWELGRQLALRDTDFATRLFRWKRRHRHDAHRQEALFDSWLYALPLHHLDDLPIDDDPELTWLLTESLLARLNRLEGVPWRYLVPDPELLPQRREGARLGPGVLRVFEVDPTWLACLRDGAFSVGRVTAGDEKRDASHTSLKHPPGRSFGLLLRTPAVRCWPDLQVEAWLPGPSAHADFESAHVRLAPVRLVRPAPDLLLALFAVDEVPAGTGDRPVAFDFHTPPERLHFGLDHDGSTWTRLLRDPHSGVPLATVEVPLRDTARHVVSAAGLAEDLRVGLVGAGVVEAVVPHTLALALLDPPDRLRLLLDPGVDP